MQVFFMIYWGIIYFADAISEWCVCWMLNVFLQFLLVYQWLNYLIGLVGIYTKAVSILCYKQNPKSVFPQLVFPPVLQ